MLIKSIKHDILSTYRDFIAIYTALLLFALIGPFIVQTGQELLIALMVFGIFGFSVATIVITFMTIIRLFNRRLFSHEGYLTMTLPIKTHITIISKVLTGLIWSTMTTLVFALSAILFLAIYFGLQMAFNSLDLTGLIPFLTTIWETGVIWKILQSFLIQLPLTLADSIYSLVLLVFVMTLVNTSFIKRYKLAAGVAIYMILSGILSSILVNIHGDSLLYTSGGIDFNLNPLLAMSNLAYSINLPNYMIELVGKVLYIAGLGYASWWLLEHKLEIE